MVSGNVRVLPQKLEDYGLIGQQYTGLGHYDVCEVEGVQTAYLDEYAVKRDFPHTRSWSRRQLKEWLAQSFGAISYFQIELKTLRNTPIPCRPGEITAFRQSHQGRGDIMKVYDRKNKAVGLIDRKNSGVNAYSLFRNRIRMKELEKEGRPPEAILELSHSSGLGTFGESLAELFRQKARQRLFDIRREAGAQGEETVEIYAVLWLPFFIKQPGGGLDRAAIILRQAHVGRAFDWPHGRGVFEDREGRRQSDYFGAAVDEGGVQITDPRLAPLFGLPFFGEWEAQESRIWAESHRLARLYDDQPQTQDHLIEGYLQQILAPLNDVWHPPRGYGPLRPSVPAQIDEYWNDLLKEFGSLEARAKEIERLWFMPLFKSEQRQWTIPRSIFKKLLNSPHQIDRQTAARIFWHVDPSHLARPWREFTANQSASTVQSFLRQLLQEASRNQWWMDNAENTRNVDTYIYFLTEIISRDPELSQDVSLFLKEALEAGALTELNSTALRMLQTALTVKTTGPKITAAWDGLSKQTQQGIRMTSPPIAKLFDRSGKAISCEGVIDLAGE